MALFQEIQTPIVKYSQPLGLYVYIFDRYTVHIC